MRNSRTLLSCLVALIVIWMGNCTNGTNGFGKQQKGTKVIFIFGWHKML